MVQPYNNTDLATAGKNYNFILSERSDFYMVLNQSLAVNTLPMQILFSVNEILLQGYVNWSTNF